MYKNISATKIMKLICYSITVFSAMLLDTISDKLLGINSIRINIDLEKIMVPVIL